jgi:hypothetical protein
MNNEEINDLLNSELNRIRGYVLNEEKLRILKYALKFIKNHDLDAYKTFKGEIKAIERVMNK